MQKNYWFHFSSAVFLLRVHIVVDPLKSLFSDDEFEISDSIGDKDFIRFAKDTKKCLFLAAGTGLTPMVGLLAARLRGRRLQVYDEMVFSHTPTTLFLI